MPFPSEVRDLSICCHSLESDSILERKKVIEKLKNLLQMPIVINWLENHDCYHKDINFTTIFKSVQGYLLKESEIIRDNASAAAMTLSDEQKLMMFKSNLRFVVKIANRNAPNIKCQVLIDSIIAILKEDFYGRHFGLFYLELFESEMMKYVDYVHNISSMNYKELLRAIMDFFRKFDLTTFDQCRVLSAIRNLIQCVIVQCSTSQHRYLFEFLIDLSEKISSSSGALIEQYLWILHHYSDWQITSARDMVCSIAEKTLTSIMPLLLSNKLSCDAHMIAMKYILLQVELHHGLEPVHIIHQNHLNFVYDDWEVIMKQIFSILYERIASLGNFQTKPKTLKILVCNEEIDLAAAFFHVHLQGKIHFPELFCDFSKFLNMDLSIPSRWTSICKLFLPLSCKTIEIQITWMKATAVLVSNFPQDLLHTDMTICFQSICEVLSSTKTDDILLCSFNLLITLLHVSVENGYELDFLLWSQLCDLAKRQALKPSQTLISDAAFESLSLLFKCSAVGDANAIVDGNTSLFSFWSSALSFYVSSSSSVIMFLITCIKENKLTGENVNFNLALMDDDYNVRLKILDWLLGFKELEHPEEVNCIALSEQQSSSGKNTFNQTPNIFIKSGRCLPKTELVSQLVFALCCADQNLLCKKLDDEIGCSHENTFIDSVYPRVESLIGIFFQIVYNNLIGSSVSNRMTHLFQAVYGVSMVANISLDLQTEFCFSFENTVPILIKISGVFSDYVNNHFNVVEEEIMGICSNLLNIVLFMQNISSSHLRCVILELKKLSVCLMIWLMNHGKSINISKKCSTAFNDISSCFISKENPVNAGLKSFYSGRKRSFDEENLLQPPSKYVCLSSELPSCSDKRATSRRNADVSGYSSDMINIVLRLCKEIYILSDDDSLLCDFFDIVSSSDRFCISNTIAVAYFFSFLKVFSDTLESFHLLQMNDVVSLLKDIMKTHFRNQTILAACLEIMPMVVKRLLNISEQKTNDNLLSLISRMEIMEKLAVGEQSNDHVKLTFIYCLASISDLCPAFDEQVFPNFCKYKVCEKLLNFLTHDNMLLVKECATSSRRLFKYDIDKESTFTKSFYRKIITLFKKVGKNLLELISKIQQETCKKLDYVLHFLKAMLNLLPSAIPDLEPTILYEACFFASSASLQFKSIKQKEFLYLMKDITAHVSSCYNHTQEQSYFLQYLSLILWKWPDSDLEIFPYYLFKYSSLSEFLNVNVDVVLPIMIFKCVSNGIEIESVVKLFKQINFDSTIAYFLGMFLSSVHGQGTSSKVFSFQKADDVIRKLLKLGNLSSANNIIHKHTPHILVMCMYYFCPYKEDQMIGSLPHILNRNALQACTSSILEFKDKQSLQIPKSFNPELILDFFSSNPIFIQDFNLHMQQLLQSTSCYEECRLVHVYRFVVTWLQEQCCPGHKKELFFVLTVLTIIKQLNLNMQQMLNVEEDVIAQQMSNTAASYLDLLSLIYKNVVHCKDTLLFETEIELHLSSCLCYIALAINKKKSKCLQLENVCKSLSDFLQISTLNKNSSKLFMVVLLSSPDLRNISNGLFSDFQMSSKLCFITEALSIVSKSHLFAPVLPAMIKNLMDFCDGHNILDPADVKRLLEIFYADSVFQQAMDCYSQNAFAKCMEKLDVQSLSGVCIPTCKSKTIFEYMEGAIIALCNVSMLDMHSRAKVAHLCLLQLSQYDALKQFVNQYMKNQTKLQTVLQFLDIYLNSGDKLQKRNSTNLLKRHNCKYELWTCHHSNYDMWICDVTCDLLHLSEDAFFHCMIDVCRMSPCVCQYILPYVSLYLCFGKFKVTLAKLINSVFSSAIPTSDNNNANRSILTCVLNVVEFIRIEQQAISNGERNGSLLKTLVKIDFKVEDIRLDVNFLLVAEIAGFCNDPSTALFYLELWAEKVISTNAGMKLFKASQRQISICVLEFIFQNKLLGDKAGDLIMQSYIMLNELDALRGCYSILAYTSPSISTVLEREGHWMEALKVHDVEYSRQLSTQGKILTCLHECGLGHVGNVYARHLEKDATFDQDLEMLRYKSAWQCCEWDNQIFVASSNKKSSSFHELFFNHLVALHRQQSYNFQTSLFNLHCFCIDSLKPNYKLFNNDRLNHTLVQLHCLKETQIIWKLLERGLNASDCADTWSKLTNYEGTSFYNCIDAELLVSSRSSLLCMIKQIFRSRNGHHHAQILELLGNHYLKCIGVACHFKRYQQAQHILKKLSETVDLLSLSEGELQHSVTWWLCETKKQTAMLLWLQHEEVFALSLLRGLLKSFQDKNSSKTSSDLLLLAELLRTVGKWMNELKFEGPAVIMHDYLIKSVEILDDFRWENNGNVKEVVASHYALAKFADCQLQQIFVYKDSHEFHRKYNLTSATSIELTQCGNSASKKTTAIIKKNFNIDKQEMNEIEANEINFLLTAVKSYLRCLELSDTHDLFLHRVCSLWFNYKLEQEVNALILEGHAKISSHKYVCLSYQMAARLSKANPSTYFASLLQTILTRVAQDHPHQVLPVMLALYNSDNMEVQTSTQNASGVSGVINAVRSKNPSLVSSVEFLTAVYIELAQFDASRWKNLPMKLIQFPRSLGISRLCDAKSRHCLELKRVVIPVCDLPLDHSSSYKQIPDKMLLSHFKQGFQTCGGINLPKVVVAVSLDGTRKKHLVKGRDDLRQDAVMQQVFEMANSLLKKFCIHEDLRICPYKVVPLTQQSGLVEWCEGTMPIGLYLAGNPIQKVVGAHERFRPSDMQTMTCRKKMISASQQSVEKKLTIYQDICTELLPVFRHFFIEKFLSSSDWYRCRRRYTQSVAVSSIVGYVVGLGDRHVQNILVDVATAEVIHIDLGVAFEQGRCLPTPETVPFRLTRDIVDGMGLTGVEGIFRRCCEKTMNTLRSSFDVIIPILEVLLYDPMHDWTIPHSKVAVIQNDDSARSSCSEGNALDRFVYFNNMEFMSSRKFREYAWYFCVFPNYWNTRLAHVLANLCSNAAPSKEPSSSPRKSPTFRAPRE